MNVIVVSKDKHIQTFKSLVEVSQVMSEMRYHTIRKKKFPFEYKGYRFTKHKVR